MLYEELKEFSEKKCTCGKSHKVPLPDICIGKGVINELPKYLKGRNIGKVFLIADENTYAAAGKCAVQLLESAGIKTETVIFTGERVTPDEKAVGSAIMRYKADCEAVVAVGSGVLNDIGKTVAAVTEKPYIIVATAPSMDGYASSTSSMELNGLKVSLPTKGAEMIIGDTEILKNAPIRSLQAGLGDMLAKYISIAEWRISHEITGEYYCEEIAALVRKGLKKCVDNASGLLKREESAVTAVFEGLILCGIAMSFAGVSRPASGVEHYFSHIWDMRGVEFGTKTELHGLQCAVATLIAARLYEKAYDITPNVEKAIKYAQAFDYGKWSEELKAFLGNGATAMIENEKKEKKYDLKKHAERLKKIIEKWDIIRGIIAEEIPSADKIESMIDEIRAPKTVQELGITGDLFTVFKATKDIRDKYVLSRLLFDIGEIEEFGRYM